MWPYKIHSEEEYNKVIEFVQEYAVSLGAEYVCSKTEKFTTYWREDYAVQENAEMKIYKFGEEYFWVEHHFLADRPFMIFSFGDTMESIFDDMDPFPYNLEEDELKAEVRYSLGIEEYPKA